MSDRDSYEREVAAVTNSGATLMMWQSIGVGANEIPERFGRDFVIERVQPKAFVIGRFNGRFKFKDAKWHWLRRR